MKSTAFLDTLRRELHGLSQPAIDEILADYREYLGDAQAAGRNEEEVVAALGDPVKLARELKAQASYRQWEQRRSFGNLMRVVASIAGLGLLQLVLLIPFLFYLLILTIGYTVSISLIIAGAGALIALGSHHLFGVPPQFTTVRVGSWNTTASGVVATPASGASGSDVDMIHADFDGLKVDHDRFELTLDDDDAHAELVTTAGPVKLSRDSDDKLQIESPSDAARALVKREDDDTVSIARDQVQVLDFDNGNDEHLNLVRGTSPNDPAYVWNITGKEGDHVRFDQDANGDTHNFRAADNGSTVVLNENGLVIDDNNDHVHISGLGGKSLEDMVTRYAAIALPLGLLGLALCIWLSVLTVRGLVRYTQRQIATISNQLNPTDEH